MSKHYLAVALMLVGALTIFSCKKDQDGNAACSNKTGWLKNGHQSVFVNGPGFIDADTLYTTIEEVGEGVYKSTSKFDDGTVYPAQSIYLQACDNSIYQSATPALENKQEAYRVDGNVGDSWVTTSTSGGGTGVTTTTTIAEKNVSKTVPAGTFVCMRLHQVSTSSAGGSITTDTYINNEAGPVMVDGISAHYELARKNY